MLSLKVPSPAFLLFVDGCIKKYKILQEEGFCTDEINEELLRYYRPRAYSTSSHKLFFHYLQERIGNDKKN